MPTVTFPLAYLTRLTQTSPAQLEKQAFSYGLDAVLREQELEVEVTAERPDLLAAEGFTRAINIYNQIPRTIPDQLEASGRTIHVSPTVESLRPCIAALVVENADLGDGGLEALIQFQEKVTQTFGRQRKKIAIGVYDLDQIWGDLRYVAVNSDALSFVPLKGDRPMTARQLLTDHPSGHLYASTLPTQDQVPVLMDERDTILSLPPIINAEGIGAVTAETRNLFIDVTGILQQTVMDTINILAHNFLDTGAQVKTVAIATPDGTQVTPSLTRKEIPFSAKFLNEVIGTSIPKQDLGLYLERMDLHPTGTDIVRVPTYRTDIFSQIDIAGDLLVAVGIENLQADFTSLKFYTGEADRLRSFVLKVGDWAQRMGLMEVKSYILTAPDLLEHFSSTYVQTANAKSRTYSATRTTLQAGLLEILSRNINAPKPINIYEIGEVLNLKSDGSIQETFLWGFASLDARASFAIAKSYIQTLLHALRIDYTLVECDASYYIPGRAASVIIDQQIVGQFGEIHPEVLQAFSFPEPVCSGELNCEILMQSHVKISEFYDARI
ncbi:MAG: phenylalanine--tRNA ligase subunit beta [Synechococcales cyanobacterium T60_A2020_003]|nr:phenylalanine--tRNA ligase subunit beta [Synechococcales cyanobacterium T60_A2020_003]